MTVDRSDRRIYYTRGILFRENVKTGFLENLSSPTVPERMRQAVLESAAKTADVTVEEVMEDLVWGEKRLQVD